MIALVAFVMTMAVLVVIHEYGHYRAALACGVKVVRFSVGFGKVIARYQKTPQSTEFVLCAWLLGGYVSMLDERQGAVPKHLQSMAFNTQSVWRRMLIVLAGPAANLLLAVVLFATVHWTGTEEERAVVGTPLAGTLAAQAGLESGDLIREVSIDGAEWVDVRSMADLQLHVLRAVAESESLRLRVQGAAARGERTVTLHIQSMGGADIEPGLMRRIGLSLRREAVIAKLLYGPAALAGLREGDRILQVADQSVSDAAHLESLIRAVGTDGQVLEQRWLVQRGQQSFHVELTPVVDSTSGIPRVAVHLYTPPEISLVRYNFAEGLIQAVMTTWDRSVLTLQMLGHIFFGQASIENLSGVVSMADSAGRAASTGAVVYLTYLAGLSVGLGVMNLLPLPVLDGGHLMYYLFELLTGRPVPDVWLERLQRGGIFFLLLLMLLALYFDLKGFVGKP